jgi:hypothetical protein
MDGIDIIDGRLAPNAGLTAALIKRSGRYNFAVVESSPAGCRLRFTDHGEVIGEVSFTADDAKRAGLTGKQNWTKWPEDMMFARALTRGARRFCADVFMGSVYTPEELGADVPMMDVTPEPAQPRQEPPPATNGHATAPAPSQAENGHQAPASRAQRSDPAYWVRQYGRCSEMAHVATVDGLLVEAPAKVQRDADVTAARQRAVDELFAADWTDADLTPDDALAPELTEEQAADRDRAIMAELAGQEVAR